MDVRKLKLTQDGYRYSPVAIWAMVDYIAQGGRFDATSLQAYDPEHTSLIALTQFEDGEIYVRDGLHRTTAIYLGRPSKLLQEDEYVIEHMTYSMFTEINLEVGFWTPFDPRAEVRLPDFANFRIQVRELIEVGTDPCEFISANRAVYAVPRQDHHNSVSELISRYFALRSALGV